MKKIQQMQSFKGDTIKGGSNKLYVLLNKREEQDEEGSTLYIADGYEVPGKVDSKIFLYQQVSDPLYFKYKRGEATEEEWLSLVQEIKNLQI